MRAKAPNADRTTEPSADAPRRPARGVWLYAVTNSRGRETSGGLPSGVADEPVRLIDAEGLTAAVGTVDLREFGEEALRRKLEDLDWLAGAARAHDRVINALARGGATVPVGLATVFADDDSVRAMLDERRANLSAALGRLAGRTEWGVKAYAASGAASSVAEGDGEGEGDGDGEGEGGSSDGSEGSGNSDASGADAGKEGAGTAFLKRKRAQLTRQQSAATAQAERAAHIHERLNRLSVSSRLYAPQNPALTGRREHMLLNGAYLVEDDGLEAFRATVTFLDAEARREGIHVELTGPWPPYSFTAEGMADG